MNNQFPPKDEFFSRDLIKVISTDFYRWWHNQPGANTDQGFDDFWQEHKHKYLEDEE